jgi:alpha-aminoadipate/glutamate carrier protein LysW
MDIEEEDLDEGEVLTCDECGATVTVVSLDPLEWSATPDEEDDDDFDEDEDEDDDEEDEEEEEEEEWH